MAEKTNEIVIVANRGFALASSRKKLITHLVECGYRVSIITKQDEYQEELEEIGAHVINANFDRGGVSLLKDVKALFQLIKIYRSKKPILIHHFHAKPIIFGNFAALFSPKSTIINNFEGLGYPFTKKSFLYFISAAAYFILMKRSSASIFLNPDDRDLFTSKKWIKPERAYLVLSPGVDVLKFSPNENRQNLPSQDLKVIMAGRLLWSKGVREFANACKTIRAQHPNVRFQIAGEWDVSHPDAITETDLQTMQSDSGVEFLGYVSDMPNKLKDTDIFVLPTRYREGVPRVILEAQASGVPVITTDVPGCRDAVLDGETGFVVPPNDEKALEERILNLIEDTEKRLAFGKRATQLAVEEFDIDAVTKYQLNVYKAAGLPIS